MEINAAVVSLESPDKAVWTGTWLDCSRFIRSNTWLYGNVLYIRQYEDGVLGNASSTYLWGMPAEYKDLDEIPIECGDEVAVPEFGQTISSGEIEWLLAHFLATAD